MERKRKKTYPMLHKAWLFNILANSLLRVIVGMKFSKNTESEFSPGERNIMGRKSSKVE